MTLGQRIQELRKRAGLSQEGLGEALGVSRQAVSKWEGDNGIPELDSLIAMSRLFGIPVGQLLGVETPEEKTEEPTETHPGFTEEQVEEILRRYVEESRRQEPVTQNTVGSWIIAACAVILTVVVAIVAIGKVREVKNTVNTLWSNVVDIENIVTNTRNQVGGLADELRGVLEEQNSLLSSFDYRVISFDVEKETVELKLTATLKTYTAGDRVQFALEWIKVDQTTGEMLCDPVEGPKFETVVTVPMNFHMEISVRIHGEDGSIHEQPAEVIYSGMHPGEYRVNSYSRSSWTAPKEGRFSYGVEMDSDWPELIYPVDAVLLIEVNGKEVYRDSVPIEERDGSFVIQGEARIDPFENVNVQAWCFVTDNHGRVEEFQLPIDMNEAGAEMGVIGW